MKTKKKAPEVIVRLNRKNNTTINPVCSCGRVYKNPMYTLEYVVCPYHGAHKDEIRTT